MEFFIITSLTKDISRFDLIGILFGHLIFGLALTQLLDWKWLKNLMSEEDKTRMLKSYTWKDLLVDGAIVTVVLGIIFLIISIFSINERNLHPFSFFNDINCDFHSNNQFLR